MKGLRGVATRLELARARRLRARVDRGADLLRRRREALITRLFEIARPAADTRRAIDAAARAAADALLEALGARGSAGVRAAGWPAREVRVTVRPVDVWGIRAAEVTVETPLRRSTAARDTAPALAGPAVVAAADRYEELVDLVLEAASRELLVRRLGEALATTSRQVNTLEHRVAPAIGERIATIARGLEEREREERVRLKRMLARRGRVTRA